MKPSDSMIFWERQRSLTAYYEACTKPVRDTYDLTQMQFNILMFLHNNPQFDTAGDLVKTRHLTKSHVSTALKELEARGWIEAYYAEGNRKSQHLRITKSAEAVITAGKAAQESFGRQILKGFSPEEMEQCRTLFDRMCENAADGLSEAERVK